MEFLTYLAKFRYPATPSARRPLEWQREGKGIKKRGAIGIDSTPLVVENVERGKESGARAANNGRQPKHPINLTGLDLKPRGVLNSLTPPLPPPKHRRRGRNPYITLHRAGKGSTLCRCRMGFRVAKERRRGLTRASTASLRRGGGCQGD